MKSLRLLRWSGSVLSPRTRPCSIQYQCQRRLPLPVLLRCQSTATAQLQQIDDHNCNGSLSASQYSSLDLRENQNLESKSTPDTLRYLPSPPPSVASNSAKLSALHARLSLPPRLPLETLARCLIDPSADPNPQFNNSALSILGSDLLGYYTGEAVLCRYPRLPTEVVFAAMYAYCGPQTLVSLTKEWGVEQAAAPGGEVDPGLLQFTRKATEDALLSPAGPSSLESRDDANSRSATRSITDNFSWRRGASSKTVYDDYFGDEIKRSSAETPDADPRRSSKGIDPSTASSNFVRALFGALYLHTGLRQTKAFFNSHILSRHLDVSALFNFRQPTRDVSRLCAREGFESPTARILSETGRKSRHPVFVVGVFSGREKLGEGSGGSLDEARTRAAVSTLKGWYLYSPLKVRVPSEMLGNGTKEWEPVLIDGGEVVV